MVQFKTRRRLKGQNEDNSPPRVTSHQSHSNGSTPSSTPTKDRSNGSVAKNTAKPSKPIYSFFNAVTEQQSVRRRDPESSTDLSDAIRSEDISEDDEIGDVKVLGKRHRLQEMKTEVAHNPTDDGVRRGPVPKFLKSSSGRTPSMSRQDSENFSIGPVASWTEAYAPKALSELAVHKKKVQDVRDWLEGASNHRHPHRLLILKGPPGSGKTATTRLLSQLLHFQLLEWHNPGGFDSTSSTFTSYAAAFEDFMVRSTNVGGLEFANAEGLPIGTEQHGAHNNGRRLVLIEEFPTFGSGRTTMLSSFRSVILQFLAGSQALSSSTNPDQCSVLAVAISESTISSGSSDNFTAHRLLGRDIISHSGTTTFEFNAIAPTILTKALKLILDKHAHQRGKHVPVSGEVLSKIAEIGDLRNAVSTLEFLYSQLSSLSTFPIPTKHIKKSKVTSKHQQHPTKSQTDQALDFVALRESTVGLFHSLGKILYNKRIDSLTSTSSMSEHPAKTKPPSETDLDFLIDFTGTDTRTFIAGLHENYLQSCFTSNDTEATLDCVNSCLDSLCDADILDTIHPFQGTFSNNAANSSNEALRQDQLAFHIACRGILDALPIPVQRRSIPRQGTSGGAGSSSRGALKGWFTKNDAFRMYYPTSLKIWRPKEDVREIVDHLTIQALDGRLARELEDVAPFWGRSVSQPGRMPSTSSKSLGFPGRRDEDHMIGPLHLGSGHSARLEMILERLPYLAKLLPRNGRLIDMGIHVPQRLIKEIDDVTRLGRFGFGDDEDGEGEDDGIGRMAWKRNGAFSNEKGDSSRTETGGLQQRIEDADVEKLTLSDDEIEDD